MTESGAHIVPSRTSILETLPKVVVHPPKIPSKSSSSILPRIFFQVRRGAFSHPIISMLMLIGVGVSATWVKGRMRKTRGGGGFFHLDGKEGFLNGGGYGKAD
jgi:protein disulfide-isomerase